MREEFSSNLLLYERRFGGFRADSILSLLLVVFISAILFHFVYFYSLIFFVPSLILILIRKDGNMLGIYIFFLIGFIVRPKRSRIVYNMNIQKVDGKLFYSNAGSVSLPVKIHTSSTMGITQKNRSDIHRVLSSMMQEISCQVEVIISSSHQQGVEDNLRRYMYREDRKSHNVHYASIYVILKNRRNDANKSMALLSGDYAKLEKNLKNIGLLCDFPSADEIKKLLSMNDTEHTEDSGNNGNLKVTVPVNIGKNFFRMGEENCMGARIMDFRAGPAYLLSQAIDSLNFSYLFTISIEKIDPDKSGKILKFLSAERGSDIRIMEKSSDPRKSRAQKQLDEISGYIRSLENDGYSLLYADMSIVAHSKDPSAVNSMMERIEAVMKFMGFDLSRLNNYSRSTISGLLPFNEKKRRYLANVPSFASILPLFLTEIPEGGVLVGFNSFTEKPERISIFGRNSYNIAVTGETGSGKSFFSRLLMERSIVSGEVERALVIDPLHEYEKNSFSFNAEMVNLADGDYLELNSREIHEQSASSIADYISAFAEGLIGNNPALKERIRMSVLDSLSKGVRGTVSILLDVADSIPELWQPLHYQINRKYRRPVKLNGEEKLTVIRLPKGNQSSIKSELFMTALFIHDWMVSVPGKKAILVDEAHLLFSDDAIEALVESIVRNSRHFQTSVIIVTQNFNDLITNKGETNIVNNTSEFFVFRNKTESESIRSFFGDLLPSPEYMRTLKGGKGDVYSECLRINNGKCYPVKITQ